MFQVKGGDDAQGKKASGDKTEQDHDHAKRGAGTAQCPLDLAFLLLGAECPRIIPVTPSHDLRVSR
jgi:hypothetical protein